MTTNQQRTDLIANQRQVWGDELSEMLCATKDCPREPEPFSCYCRECEDAISIDTDGILEAE